MFIELRGIKYKDGFNGDRAKSIKTMDKIIEEMNLKGKVERRIMTKKWDYLIRKYKQIKEPKSGEGVQDNNAAHTWKFYLKMDEILGQRHIIIPKYLIDSVEELDYTGEADCSETVAEKSDSSQKRKFSDDIEAEKAAEKAAEKSKDDELSGRKREKSVKRKKFEETMVSYIQASEERDKREEERTKREESREERTLKILEQLLMMNQELQKKIFESL